MEWEFLKIFFIMIVENDGVIRCEWVINVINGWLWPWTISHGIEGLTCKIIRNLWSLGLGYGLFVNYLI